MLRNVAPAPEERRCAGMQEPSRDAEPAPERGTWAGIRKPSRRAEAGQACGRCAGAESARGTRNPERARRRGGAAGRIREQTGRKARFPALCGAFCRNLEGRRSVAKTASASAFRRFSGRVSTKGVVLSGDWLRERAPLCEEKPPKEAARRFLRSAQAGSWGARRLFSRRLFSAES